jgi:hypothetical protein
MPRVVYGLLVLRGSGVVRVSAPGSDGDESGECDHDDGERGERGDDDANGIAEPGSPSHDAMQLLTSWATTPADVAAAPDDPRR